MEGEDSIGDVVAATATCYRALTLQIEATWVNDDSVVFSIWIQTVLEVEVENTNRHNPS